MISNKSGKKNSTIHGMVTVNEKGQVVIPVSARSSANIEAGDKLLVMVHPGNDSVVLIKPDGLEQFANHMLEQLSAAKDSDQETKG